MVGQRVVVRRVLPGPPGPTGGPALTDVLGVCESWDAEGRRVVIRRADGEAVEIRLGDIVSGKPVPPRPSVRMRLSARQAEEHALVLWPRLDIEVLGDWVLRSDPLLAPDQRLVKRANSCLAMGSPQVPLGTALSRVRRFYGARDRPALLQVETGSGVDASAVALGWRRLPEGAATFRVAPVGRALRALPAGLPGVDLVEEEAEARVESPQVRARAVLDGDWLGIHDLAVEPDHRRQGWGRAALAALLDWGASLGALTAWLHVEADNAAASALYEPLGFAVHHGYHYLAAPETGEDGDAARDGDLDGDPDDDPDGDPDGDGGAQARPGTGG